MRGCGLLHFKNLTLKSISILDSRNLTTGTSSMKVKISDRDHPKTPILILMTRLPGREIGQAYKSLNPKAKATALAELKLGLSAIRG